MRFNPAALDMGPVLPHMPQGYSREVEVLNEGTWDVEIFSLDFDKARRYGQYRPGLRQRAPSSHA